MAGETGDGAGPTGGASGGSGEAVKWLTYGEAGAALGLTAESANRKARRQGWRRVPGNDGRTRVAVPLDELPAAPPDAGSGGASADRGGGAPDDPGDRPREQSGDESHIIKVLEGAVAALAEQADRAEAAELRREMSRVRAEAARQIGELRAEVAAERDRARAAEVKAAGLDGELRGVRLALDAATRPWWRKLIGS